MFVFTAGVVRLPAETPQPRPLVKRLECAGSDCPLLSGAPETAGMRSGFVRLAPGKAVGWHTTASNEESLVILKGEGVAAIEGQQRQAFTAPALVYIPTQSRHNVTNTGKETLEYVYVVAPAAR